MDSDEEPSESLEATHIDEDEGDIVLAPSSPVVRHGPSKRPRTMAEREQARENLLSRYEEEFSHMREESGATTLLRSEESPHPLPQTVVNQVWMQVLEANVEAQLPEESVFEVENLAAGLRPGDFFPVDPRVTAVERQIAQLIRPNGSYIVPDEPMEVRPGEDEELTNRERIRVRHQALLKEKRILLDAGSDEAELLRRRRGLAGIPEVARVLATANPLWRRWWHRDFPRQVLEYGTGEWANANLR